MLTRPAGLIARRAPAVQAGRWHTTAGRMPPRGPLHLLTFDVLDTLLQPVDSSAHCWAKLLTERGFVPSEPVFHTNYAYALRLAEEFWPVFGTVSAPSLTRRELSERCSLAPEWLENLDPATLPRRPWHPNLPYTSAGPVPDFSGSVMLVLNSALPQHESDVEPYAHAARWYRAVLQLTCALATQSLDHQGSEGVAELKTCSSLELQWTSEHEACFRQGFIHGATQKAWKPTEPSLTEIISGTLAPYPGTVRGLLTNSDVRIICSVSEQGLLAPFWPTPRQQDALHWAALPPVIAITPEYARTRKPDRKMFDTARIVALHLLRAWGRGLVELAASCPEGVPVAARLARPLALLDSLPPGSHVHIGDSLEADIMPMLESGHRAILIRAAAADDTAPKLMGTAFPPDRFAMVTSLAELPGILDAWYTPT